MKNKPKIDSLIFPLRLQEAMAFAAKNTYELADDVSLTAATISRYANGHMSPKITTLYAMADSLGVNPLWLMGYDEPRLFRLDEKETPPAQGEGLTPLQQQLYDLIIQLPPENISAVIEIIKQLLKK